MKTSPACWALLLGFAWACSGEGPGGDADGSTGGATGGTSVGTGGAGGGLEGSGGARATGGSTGTGGAPAEWNAFVMQGAEAELASAYTQWKSRFYRDDCGGGVSTVLKEGQSVAAGQTVSEGIGYGMLITANLGSQAEFDGLHKFYQNAAKTESGLMRWNCSPCGDCKEASASDGDLDVAMALLQADLRWGGYAAAALDVIQNLRHGSIVEKCGALTVLRPGEWGGCSGEGAKFINPSYFAPGYYRVFAQVDAAGAETWNALIEDSYTLLASSKDGHHMSNLLWPDGLEWSGSAFGGSNGFAGNGYDACRVPWRIATDYAWSKDTRAGELLAWTSGQVDVAGMGALSTDANSAFYGALALSGTAVSQQKADAYYTAWTTADLDDAPYYQATLRLIYLMVAAGKFPSTL